MTNGFKLSAIALAMGSMLASPANGATLTVTSTADNTTASDGLCTLREAIVSVNSGNLNADCSTSTPGNNDQIVFGSSLTSASTITLGGSHLSIQKDVSIEGPAGAGRLTVHQGGVDRVITIPYIPKAGPEVTISNLTLSGGSHVDGGGIYVRKAELSLTNCVVSGNSVSNTGGGIAAFFGATVNVTDSVINSNFAQWYGGGIEALGGISLVISNSEISQNSASGTGGGGIHFNNSHVIIRDSTTLLNNSSGLYGGGIFGFGGSLTLTGGSTITGSSAASRGGAISVDYATFVSNGNSSISSNTAQGYGGGLDAHNSLVTIEDTSIVNNRTVGSSGGGLSVRGANAIATFRRSTISNNNASNFGGGIFATNSKLNIATSSNVSANYSSGFGGGIDAANAVVTINDSSVSHNTAGVYNGGAMSLRGADARATIQRATIDSNAANGTGGGVYVSSGSLVVTDSTVSLNASGNKGGGLMANNSGSISVVNSTIVANYANSNGGGINWYQAGGTTYGRIVNSIVSGNTSNAAGQEIAADFGPIVVNDGSNVLGHSVDTSAQAFAGFTPAASDITATSDGTIPTAFSSILGIAQYTPIHKVHPIVEDSPAIGLADAKHCPDRDQLGRDRGVTFFVPIKAANGNITTLDFGSENCDVGSVLFGG